MTKKNLQRWPVNSKPFRSFVLCFSAAAIWLIATLAPDAARAQTPSNDQAVNTTMQIFTEIANVAGVPIPPETIPVMQGMLGCAVAGTSIGDCAKNIAISTAISQIGQNGTLDDTTKAALTVTATCFAGGKSVGDCLKQGTIAALPPEAQPLATCIAGGKNLGDCAQSVVLNQVLPQLGVSVGTGLPKDVQSALTNTVSCVAGGSTMATCGQQLVNNALTAAGVPPAVMTGVNALENCAGRTGIADCAKSVATANLPPDVQTLQSCLSGGTAAQTCVANFASGRIPDPTAAALVGCMGGTSGTQVQGCVATTAKGALGNAAQQAAQQATQNGIASALTAIQNMQTNLTSPQTPPQFPQTPAVLQNLLSVAQGIQQGDWSKVALGVGPEAVEIAGKIILSVFLTPAVGSLLAPVVDAMIQNDVNAFENGLKDLSNANAVAVAQDIFKWYETTFIQAPCALMPSGAFTNTVCNGLAEGINWVAQEGGDLAKDILKVGENILKGLGLWNFVDNTATAIWNDVTSVISDIGRFLGIGDNKPTIECQGWPSPSDYFANNVLSACLSPGAANAALNGGKMSTAAHDAVARSCISTYELCPIANKAAVTNNCNAMADALSAAANNTSAALVPAAYAFAKMDLPVIAASMNAKFKQQSNPQNICTSDALNQQEASFVSQCTAALAAHFQLPQSNGSCANGANLGGTTSDALTQACMSAFAEAPPAVGPNGSLCTQWAGSVSPCSKTVTYGEANVTITEPNTSVCGLIKPPRGWGTTGPFRPIGVQSPFVHPVGGSWQLPFRPLPIAIGFVKPVPIVGGGGTSTPKPITFTPDPFRPKSPPKLIITPPASTPRQPPRLVPPPQASGGGGGSNSAMDNLGALNTNGNLTGVAGTGNAGGGPGPVRQGPGQRLPPIGGKPGVIVGAKPPPFGGGTNGVMGNTGNAPTGNGAGKPVTVTATPKPAPSKPSTPASSDTFTDYGGCPGCSKTGGFVAPK